MKPNLNTRSKYLRYLQRQSWTIKLFMLYSKILWTCTKLKFKINAPEKSQLPNSKRILPKAVMFQEGNHPTGSPGIFWIKHTNLMFRWPYNVKNSYNKTNQMHSFLKFTFRIKLYMFRTVPLSIIRSFSLYTQHITYTIAMCTVKNSWWWTEELSETCRVLFQKQIWEINASGWFYYKNLKYTAQYGSM